MDDPKKGRIADRRRTWARPILVAAGATSLLMAGSGACTSGNLPAYPYDPVDLAIPKQDLAEPRDLSSADGPDAGLLPDAGPRDGGGDAGGHD